MNRIVTIVADPSDAVAGSPPARWAAKELQDSMGAHGVAVHMRQRAEQAGADDLCVVAAGLDSPVARAMLRQESAVRVAAAPEALGLIPANVGGRPVLLACGHDAAGLAYALLELADRAAAHAADPFAALEVPKPIVERPANTVRGVTRLFTSDVEDLPWYHDRRMWPHYLTMLAANRFNRFSLALGIGYDFLRNVTDAYFLFPYPFFLSVPGYDVRVPQLPDAERESNLDMLKFISEETVRRGMRFQLGLWMHGYEWIDSPHPKHTVEGLTRRTHGPYCRDAIRELLQACPAIGGVTFRVHGESGVEEGSYEFWKMVFDGVATCGRRVEIDMHSKGMDQTMLDLAVATGLPVRVSPKYWAEHLGLPYHQTDIRQLERPRADHQATGLMKFSTGTRSFLRYGYGDLLREDRRWGVLHRIWAGTQRLLLWGDPLFARAYSRAFSFCGSDGVEIMEPLSFKGRRGSGLPGGRCAYADESLKPRWDWEKYVYTYRVWGRLLYNPDSEADTWRRGLRKEFGAGAEAAEAALAAASRILPTLTTGHGACAANNLYWPEMYWNHTMIDAENPGPYWDSPSPRVFGNVSPLDPQLFLGVNDFADELLGGERGGEYSPIEVAQWIEDSAAAAEEHFARADQQVAGRDRPEWRRWRIDVALQAGLGRFFGAKLRSGVLYRLFERTGEPAALAEALKAYRAARTAWAELAHRAEGVYVSDVTVGEHPFLRGHWMDRLTAIDEDIAAMAAKAGPAGGGAPGDPVALAIAEALGRPRRQPVACRHTPPAHFERGRAIDVVLSLEGPPAGVRLHYRHVTQAERFETLEMETEGCRSRATIPAGYTDPAYPLQYYFEVRQGRGVAGLVPGLGEDLTNQPYFVVRQAGTR